VLVYDATSILNVNGNAQITGNTAGNGGGIYSVGTVTIRDLANISGNSATTACGGIYNYSGVGATTASVLNMEGGIISGNVATGGNGGGVCNTSGVGRLTNGAIFNMSGGVIENNQASVNGGGVINANSGNTMTMTGGVICGNRAPSGGGISNASANLNINGGEVSGNTATNVGGGIYMGRSGADEANIPTVAHLENAIISGNFANAGAGIYATGANSVGVTLIVAGQSKIQNNATTGGGGGGIDASTNVNIDIIDESVVSGNSATHGGGLFVLSSGVSISGNAEFSDNTATISGAAMAIFDDSAVTVSDDVLFDSNISGDSGGVAYVSNNTVGHQSFLIINSGKFINNQANYGGAIAIGRDGTLTVNGGEFQGNVASSRGGAAIVFSDAYTVAMGKQLNISSASFIGNVAGTNGGAIDINYNSLARLNVAADVAFSDNKAATLHNIAPIDQPTYNAHIFATQWSTPNVQGYNNYDIAYTATPESFVVNFDSNGGSAVDYQLIESGQKANKPSNPTRAGYKFVSWFTDAEYTTAYDFDAPVVEDVTLYAQWEKIPVTPPDSPDTPDDSDDTDVIAPNTGAEELPSSAQNLLLVVFAATIIVAAGKLKSKIEQ
jgi:uncharacterized repeat protein (TIGR02543 family)